MDISIIPTIQRSKKPAKPRYIKPDSVKRLEADYYEWKYRNSTIPPQCRVKPHFRDDTANGLAKCIGNMGENERSVFPTPKQPRTIRFPPWTLAQVWNDRRDRRCAGDT